MIDDFYRLLRRAIDGLDRPSEEARFEVYERARKAVVRRLGDVTDEAEIDRQLEALQAAVRRIEDGFKAVHAPPPVQSAEEPQPVPATPLPRRRTVALASAAAILGIAIVGSYFAYQATRRATPVASAEPPRAARNEQKSQVVADSDMRSYILRRQRVFYRTTHPPGTIIVSRDQRFLYVVAPQQVAIRYAIGVGPECATIAGLFHVTQKLGPAAGAPNAAAGTATPSAYALVFSEPRAVHETTEPQNIGQSATKGCFHSVQPDIADLYERVPLNERLVVTN